MPESPSPIESTSATGLDAVSAANAEALRNFIRGVVVEKVMEMVPFLKAGADEAFAKYAAIVDEMAASIDKSNKRSNSALRKIVAAIEEANKNRGIDEADLWKYGRLDDDEE